MTACPFCRIPRFLLNPREAFQEARDEPFSSTVFTVVPLVPVFAVLVTCMGILFSPPFSSGPWHR